MRSVECWLSNLVGKLAALQQPVWLVTLAKQAFASFYQLNLQEAELNLAEYASLQALFVRRLRANVRPLSSDLGCLVSPVDGCLQALGSLSKEQRLHIKGQTYRLSHLLEDTAWAEKFVDGHYATLYLAPGDYHAFHTPADGVITYCKVIPGRLFPLTSWAQSFCRQLYCRNERVVIGIDTQQFGEIMLVAVGAMLVGSIQVAFDAKMSTHAGDSAESRSMIYAPPLPVERGQRLGHFAFGSSVIMLLPAAQVDWQTKPGAYLRMGQALLKLPSNRHLPTQ